MADDPNGQLTRHALRMLRDGPVVAYAARGGAPYRIDFVSPNASHVLGYQPGEITEGSNFWAEHIHPDDRGRVEANLDDPDGAGRLRQEYRFRHKSGEWKWLRDDSERTADGSLNGTWADITADRLALQESESKLRDFAESAADWFWETDENHCFVTPRSDREPESPFRKQSFVGKTRVEVSGESTNTPKWDAHLADLEARRPFRDFVYSRIDHDGRSWHIKVSGLPFFDADGVFKGYRGAGADATKAMESEQAVRASEERFRILIETSNQGIVVLRFDEILFANQAFADILGYPDPETILGLGSPEAWLPTDEQIRMRNYAETRLGGGSAPDSYEFKAVRKNGTTVWLENHSNPIEWNGQTAILSANTDVTTRRAAQDALEESEKLYRSILDSMMDVYYRSDKDGRLVMASPSFENLLGYELSQAIGTNISNFYAEEGEPEKFLAALRASNGNIRGYEAQLKRADGQTVWVSGNGQYCFDTNNNVIGIEGTVRDITERRELEEAVRAGERNFLDLFENTTVGIAIRRDEKVVYANLAFANLFGYAEPSELVALDSITKILAEGERARFREIYELRERDKAPEFMEFQGLKKDGSTVWIEQWVQTILWEGSSGYLAFSVDITNRKAVEGHLKAAQRLETIGKLAGGVAHEFNNLLTVVIGNLEFAQDTLDGHKARPYVERAKKGALRGADLTHQLLAYSRRQPLQPVTVATEEILERAAAMMRPTLSGHIDIETTVAYPLWNIHVDPGQLEDALLNLVINARDASPDGGSIQLEGSNVTLAEPSEAPQAPLPSGDYVAIRVTDHGTGMDRTISERAFEPFFTTKDVGKGTGLGLSMVYGFAKQSGGDVRIKTASGQGTSVTLYLPRAVRTSGIAVADETERLAPNGSGTVLIIEDDDEVREIAEALVSSLGYTVITDREASRALRILRSDKRIDLLLTDVILPNGASGFELADIALNENPNLKVIFATGYDSATIAAEQNIERRRTRFLMKPYNRSEIAHSLQDLFSAH
jgi:PAS domain S-box-containing protein